MQPEIFCKDIDIQFPREVLRGKSQRDEMRGSSESDRSFLALDHISVSIFKDERVGILGSNGAGKSTFLRTLAGVYPPSSGILEVRSPTTNLFEVGVGTDPDASGYENIPLLMASRGISRSEMGLVTQDVEEFTRLGNSLNQPLRTYSQGMRLRIAFAVATYSCSGILLMDEEIGVGDKNFRRRSRQRLRSMMHSAGTLLLASHSNQLLKNHCERGLVIEKGAIIFDGAIDDAINFYEKRD